MKWLNGGKLHNALDSSWNGVCVTAGRDGAVSHDYDHGEPYPGICDGKSCHLAVPVSTLAVIY